MLARFELLLSQPQTSFDSPRFYLIPALSARKKRLRYLTSIDLVEGNIQYSFSSIITTSTFFKPDIISIQAPSWLAPLEK